jgi:hypothetical protein
MAIGDQRVHPRVMAKQLNEVLKEFRVLMIDYEMGTTSVYSNTNYEGNG